MGKTQVDIITLPGSETQRLVGILEELAAYHNTVAEDFAGRYPLHSPEKQMREAGAMVDAGEARIYAVMENNAIVGFGMASFSGKTGEIDFLYLRPELRGQGLGKELTERLLAFLRERDVDVVDVHVVRGNPATAFYRQHGFRPRSETLSLELR